MANAHFARVQGVEIFESGGHLLRLEIEDPASLARPIAPGEYVIVNSGLTLPSGKIAKRAYSAFETRGEGRFFSLAAERLEGGAVSQYLNSLAVGDSLQFSGPWGKFLAPAEGWPEDRPLIGIAFATVFAIWRASLPVRPWSCAAIIASA